MIDNNKLISDESDNQVNVKTLDDELILEDDEEMQPPEDDNEETIINTGNIIGIIMAVILVVFIIVFIGLNVNGKKNKKQKDEELDKAGSKTVIEFKEKAPVEYTSTEKESYDKKDENNEIDEVLDTLPVQIKAPSQGEPGIAPITSVGNGNYSSYSNQVDEIPDTRHSKSPRKIEGLAVLDYQQDSNVGNSNNNLIRQIMSGNYSTNTNGQKMTRDEFIQQQLSQTQELQKQYTENQDYQNIRAYDKNAFFNQSSGSSGSGNYLSKSSLWDGTIISGALITAINTDNPGIVIARVTEDVYSSQDHSYLLIPEGSLLMATYNSSVSYGQNMVQVAWNLLIRPDNYRVQLGNMNGVNQQGASGYEGKVSNHPFETMKALGMVAVYSIVQTEVSKDIENLNNEYLQNALSDVYSQASSIGNKIVDRALNINPTVKIPEGTEIKLITNTPLELPPVEIRKPAAKYIRLR